MTIAQQNSGSRTGAGDFTVSLASAPASTSSVVVILTGITATATPSGWTLRQSDVHAGRSYLWDRSGDGSSNSWTFTAGASVWWTIFEIPNATHNVSAVAYMEEHRSSFPTPSITPTAGDRTILAAITTESYYGAASTFDDWSNSFTELVELHESGGDWHGIGVASRDVTASGSTSYNSVVTYSSTDARSQVGITAAYAVSAAPLPVAAPVVVTRRQPEPARWTVRPLLWLRTAIASSAQAGGSGSLDLAGAVSGAALVTATGAVTLGGSAAARGALTAVGSLALGGASSATAPVTAAGSVGLDGSAAAAAPVIAAGSLALGGTASAEAAPSRAVLSVVSQPAAWRQSGTVPFVWIGSGVVEEIAATAATASGSLTLGGTASAGGAVTASGSLGLGGSALAAAPVTTAGAIVLGGSAASAAPVTAAGSLTLGGAATAAAPASASGSLSLAGAVSASAPVTAAGSLDLGGTAQAGIIALGGLTFSGAASVVASTTAAGSLTLDGSAAASVVATAAGNLTLDANGAGAGATVAIGTLTLDGWATLAAESAATGLLSLGAVMRTGPQRGRAHSHIPARPTAGHYQPD